MTDKKMQAITVEINALDTSWYNITDPMVLSDGEYYNASDKYDEEYDAILAKHGVTAEEYCDATFGSV